MKNRVITLLDLKSVNSEIKKGSLCSILNMWSNHNEGDVYIKICDKNNNILITSVLNVEPIDKKEKVNKIKESIIKLRSL